MSIATPLHAHPARRPVAAGDRIWTRLRDEAETMLGSAPEFGALIMSTLLGADGFEDAVADRKSVV